MNLWDHLEKIEQQLQLHPIKLLMLDFDGTLSPMASHPEKAVLPLRTKQLLITLSSKPNVFLAVISGRGLKNLKEKVDVFNLMYAGNHGMEEEIFGKYNTLQISAQIKSALQLAKEKLMQLNKKYSPTVIEDKGLILGFHYRLLDSSLVVIAKNDFYEIAKQFNNELAVFQGNHVLELRPKTSIDKGVFIKNLIEKIKEKTHTTPLPIYIGDEQTDEDAFKALQNGITIKVGPLDNSSATYSLTDTEDVSKFLEWLSKKM